MQQFFAESQAPHSHNAQEFATPNIPEVILHLGFTFSQCAEMSSTQNCRCDPKFLYYADVRQIQHTRKDSTFHEYADMTLHATSDATFSEQI